MLKNSYLVGQLDSYNRTLMTLYIRHGHLFLLYTFYNYVIVNKTIVSHMHLTKVYIKIDKPAYDVTTLIFIRNIRLSVVHFSC